MRFKNYMLFMLLFMFLSIGSINIKTQAAIYQSKETTTSVTVRWDAEPSARSYYIGYGNTLSEALEMYSSKPITLPGENTVFSFSKLEPNSQIYMYLGAEVPTTYSTEIKPLGNIEAHTSPLKVTGVAKTEWSYDTHTVGISWDDIGNTFYEVQFLDNKNQVVYTDTAENRTSSECSKVKNKKQYYARVRAFVNVTRQGGNNRAYGEWSDTVVLFTQPMVTSLKITKGKLKIKWGKIAGLSSYDIYISTKEKNGYKKVKSVNSKKGSVTIKKFKGKKFNLKKKYYVYVIGKMKHNGSTYTSDKLYSMQLKKKKTKLRWSFK